MSKHEEVYKNTQKLCLGGILLSMAIVLSFAESAFPPLPFLPVGVKLGTANIITMYCLFFMGKRWAFSIGALRSLFVVFTRGPVAGILSLSGGIFSLAAIILFSKIFKGADKFYLSIIGGVFHNAGQLASAVVILKNSYLLFYLPVLILSGILMGAVTGILLRLIMPYLAKATRHFK